MVVVSQLGLTQFRLGELVAWVCQIGSDGVADDVPFGVEPADAGAKAPGFKANKRS